jgi:diguanylate cyclase (GGDEF)-like protein
VGRIGGDEFLLLLPDTGLEEAFTLAERLRRRVATTPLSYAEHAIALTVSIGVSGIAAGDADVDAVLARADHALYEAKNAGRDTVRAAAAPVATPAGTAPSPR